MDCYKFTISEAFKHTSRSSKAIIHNILKMVYGDLQKKTNKDLGVMYQENDDFPKEYYIRSMDTNLLQFFIDIYNAEPANYPPTFAAGTPKFQYIGNPHMFPPKL